MWLPCTTHNLLRRNRLFTSLTRLSAGFDVMVEAGQPRGERTGDEEEEEAEKRGGAGREGRECNAGGDRDEDE